MLLNLVFLPLTIRNIGLDRFGVLTAILALINIFLVIDLGATNSLMTQFAKEFSSKESIKVNELLTNSFILILAWLTLLFVFASIFFRSIFRKELPEFILDLKLDSVNGLILYWLISLTMIANVAGRLLFGMNLESRAYKVSLIINSLAPVAVYISSFSGSVMLMISAQLSCSIIVGGGVLTYILFVSKEVRLEIRLVQKKLLLGVLKNGSLYQYLQLFAVINAQIFPLYALFAFGDAQAGMLTAILKVCSFPITLIGFATLPLWVSASKEVHKENASLLYFFKHQFVESFAISMLFAMVFGLAGQRIMEFVIGEQSTRITTNLILSACAFTVVLGVSQPLSNILNGAGSLRFLYLVNPTLFLVSLACIFSFEKNLAESAIFLGLAAANLFVFLLPGLVYLHRSSRNRFKHRFNALS